MGHNDCNKMGFDTKKAAMKEASRIKSNIKWKARGGSKTLSMKSSRKFRAYECHKCGYWHLTTTNPKNYKKS